MLTLRELHAATQMEEDCRGWLHRKGLLPVNMACPRCNSVMEECQYSRVSNGIIWRCPPKQCRATISVRKGSFFKKSHLPLTKLCDLLHYWSIGMNKVETQFQAQSSFYHSQVFIQSTNAYESLYYSHCQQ